MAGWIFLFKNEWYELKNWYKRTYNKKYSQLFEKEEYFEKSGNLEKEILETEKLLKSNEEVLAEYKNQLEENKNQNLAFILGEKLEENPADPQYIMTKWGVGYYFKK